MTDAIIVLTTFEKESDAARIGRELVELRLAACTQLIGPIRSTYHWQGAIEQAEEWLCLIKSRRELYVELERAIVERHPYTTPQVLAVPVLGGFSGYLDWLASEVKNPKIEN